MNYTQKPKMILFDVGGTLFDDGTKDIMEYGYKNEEHGVRFFFRGKTF